MVFAFKEKLSRDSFRLPALHRKLVALRTLKPSPPTHGQHPFHGTTVLPLMNPALLQLCGGKKEFIYCIRLNMAPKFFPTEKQCVWKLLLKYGLKGFISCLKTGATSKGVNELQVISHQFHTEDPPRHRDWQFQSHRAATEKLMKLQPFLWIFTAKFLHTLPWHHSPAQLDLRTKWDVINWIC